MLATVMIWATSWPLHAMDASTAMAASGLVISLLGLIANQLGVKISGDQRKLAMIRLVAPALLALGFPLRLRRRHPGGHRNRAARRALCRRRSSKASSREIATSRSRSA
jgi:hypothetical protein